MGGDVPAGRNGEPEYRCVGEITAVEDPVLKSRITSHVFSLGIRSCITLPDLLVKWMPSISESW